MDEPEPIDLNQIRSGPIRHESLSPEVIEQMEAVCRQLDLGRAH